MNCDFVAIILKSLTSVAEPKEVYVQFGATDTNFHNYLMMDIKYLVQVLSEDYRAKVYCDQSAESLKRLVARKRGFQRFLVLLECWMI